MSKNVLNEALDREIQRREQSPSARELYAILTGKDNKRSISKSVKKYTEEERAERIAKMRAKREGTDAVGSEEIDHLDHTPKIDHINKIPDGFPKDTIMNDDGTLTLPDGRQIRKIEQEVHNEEAKQERA